MSIVGGYTLDLYCDHKAHVKAFDYWSNPSTFCGHTKSYCYAEARKSGWKLAGKKAICPKCAGKKERETKVDHDTNPGSIH